MDGKPKRILLALNLLYFIVLFKKFIWQATTNKKKKQLKKFDYVTHFNLNV